MRYINMLIALSLFASACVQNPPKQQKAGAKKPVVKAGTAHADTIKVLLLPDTSDRLIYDFIKMVIKKQKLDTAKGLEQEPAPGCSISENDKVFLKTLLVKIPEPPVVDQAAGRSGYTWTFVAFEDPWRCLAKKDIRLMLERKEHYASFKWNPARLGFDTANHRERYRFSVPLFSADGKKAVMMVEELCPGLCGHGETILFKKTRNKWSAAITSQWDH